MRLRMTLKRRAVAAIFAVVLSPALLADDDGPPCVAGAILRMTPAGTFREYRVPSASGGIDAIVEASDGTVWFTERCGKIGRVTASGSFTEYAMPNWHFDHGITVGPDRSLWFTETDRIGRITTAGKTSHFALPTDYIAAAPIVSGPDGTLWFFDTGRNRIGRMTTSGAFSESALTDKRNRYGSPTAGVESITAGPDGGLWLTGSREGTDGRGSGRVFRMTTSGSVTEYPLPRGIFASSIATGSDGALWFTEYTNPGRAFTGQIGRMTTAGAYSEFSLQTVGLLATAITPGADGLWFIEHAADARGSLTPKVGRLTIRGDFTEYRLPTGRDAMALVAGRGHVLWIAVVMKR